MRGKLPEAIDLYGKACGIPPESEKAISKIAEEPDSSDAYRAATEKLIKNFPEQARQDIRTVDEPGCGVGMRSGNLPEAINQYKKAIEIWPYSAILYVNLGATLEASKTSYGRPCKSTRRLSRLIRNSELRTTAWPRL